MRLNGAKLERPATITRVALAAVVVEMVDWTARNDTYAAARLNTASKQAVFLIVSKPGAGRMRRDIIESDRGRGL